MSKRTTFKPSQTSIVITSGKEVHLRPKGGDKFSAYLKLTIREDDNIAAIAEPFAGLSFVLALTDNNLLSELAELLEELGDELVLSTDEEIPICRFTAVDAVARTVTILLDEDVESFEPDPNERFPSRKN